MAQVTEAAAIRVLYFAWLREKIGSGEETVRPAASVDTVERLVDYLSGLDDRHRAGFAQRATIRCAVNQVLATPQSKVVPGDEVAFFPPVTGG